MQKEIINGCELYLADALEVLPTLDPVNMICCDPPYLLTSGGKTAIMGGSFSAENYSNDGKIVTCDIDWTDFMAPMARVLERGHAYIMFNNLHVEDALREARLAGFNMHNLLVWYKKTKTQNRWYMKSCEFTGFFYRGKARAINDCGSDQHIEMYHSDVSGRLSIDGKPHPTEKPVALMEHYIRNSTKRGEIVLDPFMGAGSTGVAAVKTGRKFIGIEIEPRWFDVACKRISDARYQEYLGEDKTALKKLMREEKKNQTELTV